MTGDSVLSLLLLLVVVVVLDFLECHGHVGIELAVEAHLWYLRKLACQRVTHVTNQRCVVDILVSTQSTHQGKAHGTSGFAIESSISRGLKW
jgi:hypothetical protein